LKNAQMCRCAPMLAPAHRSEPLYVAIFTPQRATGAR
jgi:hypothetical protein